MNSVIYSIFNKVNGHQYIGSSSNVKYRFYTHKNTLRKGTHHSIALQRAWNKYGEDSFVFKIILHSSPEDNIHNEQQIMNLYKPVYNCSKTAGSPTTRGSRHTPEHKRKISEGLKRWVRPPGMADNISKAKKGKPLSEDHKKKLRLAKPGLPSDILLEIKNLIQRGDTLASIGKLYGVGQTTVFKIKHNRYRD